MYKLYIYILFVLFCFCDVCANERENSFASLRELFKDVPTEYRTVPFWSWNYKVTESEIDRMLIDFKKKGFGGVFVHPRYGMVTEYLSDEWFELYDYTIQKAEELGLYIWIYDENAYPSGFAGGLLPYLMPKSYELGQGLEPVHVSILPSDYDQYFVILCENRGVFFDITNTASTYVGKEGDFYLYKKTYYPDSAQPSRAWYAGFSYTDLILPEVTEKFIEITMSGYEKKFLPKFGKSIKGVFSDEINIRSSGGFRWTPDLFDMFEKKYGYDLKEHLPSLHLNVGDWKKVRYDYSKLLLELFVERWAKPWFEYCNKHNLVWTGHYWEQTWPGIEQVPDNMAMTAWQQMPGIDMLSNTFDEHSTSGMFGNVRVVKEAKSIANQMGRKRMLCEAYGGGGWSMSFKDFKRHSDWLNVMGVNFMNQHLAHMSFVGVRKYDWPPMFSSMASWWEDYGYLNEYLARMSLVMSLGKQDNDILVLEPTTTTWMYAQHINSGGNKRAKEIGNAFQNLVTSFSKNQVEYDLGCEYIIAQCGRVDSGHFIVGECSYSTVVIPEFVENMDSTCFSLLKEFVRKGGKLISFSNPICIDGIESTKIKQLFKDERIEYIGSVKDERWKRLLSSPNISFVKQEGGNLFHHRRIYDDGELLLLTNSSLLEKSHFMVEIKGKTVVELDAFSGDIFSYPCEITKENCLLLEGGLEPAESIILYICNNRVLGEKIKEPLLGGEKINSLNNSKAKLLRDNVLIIDYLDLIQKDSIWKGKYFLDANFEVFKNAGFKNGNPWFRAVQFKKNIINKDVSCEPGFSAIYSFNIVDSINFSSLKLLCERAPLYKISVNGSPLAVKGVSFLDKDFHLFPIGEYLHVGINKIELSIQQFNVEAEIEPIYILGDFSVCQKNGEWVIKEPSDKKVFSSLKENGAPFYPWEICYTKLYDIKQIGDRYYVSVPKWNGSLLQVWVNGVKAGIMFIEPYKFEITNFLKLGKNRVEIRVIGNMDNFIGPHHNRSQGSTPPWDWQKDITDGYILSDYGLFEDFELYHIKE